MTASERRVVDELSAGGRLLVSRLQYLGDVVLTLPVVYALRDRFPRAEIDYLARGAAADIIRGEPVFSDVIRLPEKGEGRAETWRVIRRLRSRRYAAAIDLYSNPRSALLTWLSGARMRIGGARRARRHLYTHPTDVPAGIRPATEHHLAHAKILGVTAAPRKPVLTISPAEKAAAARALEQLGVSGTRPVVGVHPGGKWEVKRWPVSHFAALSKRLIGEHGMEVVVLCGPGEETHRDELRAELGDAARYLPVLPVRETAGVIGELDGIVVCDGGIMHVAVAVGTPTVGIFGSSEPDVWFPYEQFGPFVPAWKPIACRPCHSHFCSHISCLRDLTAGEVEEKLLVVLSAERRSEAGAP